MPGILESAEYQFLLKLVYQRKLTYLGKLIILLGLIMWILVPRRKVARSCETAQGTSSREGFIANLFKIK